MDKIIKEPFRSYTLDEDKDKAYKILTVRLNQQEYDQLQKDKKILEQKKDGTALKQLWTIGRNILHDDSTGLIIRFLFINKRNNKRKGISDFE